MRTANPAGTVARTTELALTSENSSDTDSAECHVCGREADGVDARTGEPICARCASIRTDGGRSADDSLTRSRVCAESSVSGDVSGDMNFLTPTVKIEISGADEESGDVWQLHDELRRAVAETIRDFDPSAYPEVDG